MDEKLKILEDVDIEALKILLEEYKEREKELKEKKRREVLREIQKFVPAVEDYALSDEELQTLLSLLKKGKYPPEKRKRKKPKENVFDAKKFYLTIAAIVTGLVILLIKLTVR